ncbi:hypothetical protein DFH09DRAFT_1320999 [Mycena vulgaris]|nr:hypothetical protein DFH09DRAFT_1320999 [Mycena vulgaris]
MAGLASFEGCISLIARRGLRAPARQGAAHAAADGASTEEPDEMRADEAGDAGVQSYTLHILPEWIVAAMMAVFSFKEM